MTQQKLINEIAEGLISKGYEVIQYRYLRKTYAFTVKWDGGSRYIRRGDITQTDREYQPLNNEMLNIDWKLGTWEVVK